MMSLAGIPIHVTPHAVERVADWSACRSPARAKRRAMRGHRQHMRMVERPVIVLLSPRSLTAYGGGALMMTPETLAVMRMEAARQGGGVMRDGVLT